MYKLPLSLQSQLDQQVKSSKAAQDAFIEMTTRYRAGKQDRGLRSNDEAMAYALARLPATYSVLRELLDKIVDDDICSILDIGAGPGHSVWAAHDRWPNLKRAILIEPDSHMSKVQQKLLEAAPIKEVDARRASGTALGDAKADIVICSYVLNELEATKQQQLIESAWRVTNKYLIVIYPGAHRYFADFLQVRDKIIGAGGSIIAPCPHMLECPIDPKKDWCHFPVHVPRAKSHVKVKDAKHNHEDEKFTYLIASKSATSNDAVSGRIVKKPMQRKGHIVFDVCASPDSRLCRTIITKSDDSYKQAKQAKWGDAWPPN